MEQELVERMKRVVRVVVVVKGEVLPGHTMLAYSAPQRLFRATRFVIPDERVARAVEVVDFKVGCSSCGFGVPVAASGMLFHGSTDPEEYDALKLSFYTAEVGNNIGVMVKNISDEAVCFEGAFVGESIV